MKETWKEVPGYETSYLCSDLGRVKSLSRVVTYRDGRTKTIREKILALVHRPDGYKAVTLCEGGKRHITLVHRIVALTFIPNPENLPTINHKNEDKADNRANNLEWCTVAYNNTYGDRVQKIADKKRGRKHSEETRQKMSNAHRNPSEESRRRMSEAQKGRKHTEQTRQKIAEYAQNRKRQANGRWCRGSL